MTVSQRRALTEMVNAILACSCAPGDIRFRAENLRDRLVRDDLSARFADLFGAR